VGLDQPPDVEEGPPQQVVVGDDPDRASRLHDVELRAGAGWLRQVDGILEARDALERDEFGAQGSPLLVRDPGDRRRDRNERGDQRLGPATAATARS